MTYIPVLMYALMFYFLGLIDYVGLPFFLTGLVFLLVMVTIAVLVLDHSLRPSYTTVTLYSDGLEMRPSVIERFKGIPPFLPRLDIEMVRFSEMGTGVVRLNDGKQKRLGTRGREEAARMIEVLRSDLNISVDDSNFVQRKGAHKVAVNSDVPAQYCHGCGTRFDYGENYCSQCGRAR